MAFQAPVNLQVIAKIFLMLPNRPSDTVFVGYNSDNHRDMALNVLPSLYSLADFGAQPEFPTGKASTIIEDNILKCENT